VWRALGFRCSLAAFADFLCAQYPEQSLQERQGCSPGFSKDFEDGFCQDKK
jgi:hypothetical protein